MFKCYLLQRLKVLTIVALFMADILPPVNGSIAMQQSIVKTVLAKCKTAIDKCRATGAPCRKVSFNKDSETCVIFDQQQSKVSTTQSITTTTTTLSTTVKAPTTTTPLTRTTPPPTTTTAQTTTTPLTTTTTLTTTKPLITTTSLTTTTALTTTAPPTTTTTHTTTTPLTTTTTLTATTLTTTTPLTTTTTPLTTTTTLKTTTITTTTTPTTTPPPLSYLSIKYISQSTDQTTFTHSFNTAELTICFWMKMSCSLCGLFAIFNDPPTNDCNSHLIYSKDYNINLFGKYTPTKVFNEGQLYHICIAWKTNHITYYADGQSYSSHAISDNQIVGNRFIVGNDIDPINGKCIADEKVQSFMGQIAGAFMWNRFLSSSEVQRQFEGTLTGSSPDVTWNQMLNFQTTPKISKENLVVGSSSTL